MYRYYDKTVPREDESGDEKKQLGRNITIATTIIIIIIIHILKMSLRRHTHHGRFKDLLDIAGADSSEKEVKDLCLRTPVLQVKSLRELRRRHGR